MKLRRLITGLFLIVSCLCHASSFFWGEIQTYSGEGNGLGIFCSFTADYSMAALDVYITAELCLEEGPYGAYRLNFGDGGSGFSSCGNVVAAKQGDIVSSATTRDLDGGYLYHACIDDGGHSAETSLTVFRYTTWTYVAFVCSDENWSSNDDPSYVYGWICLHVDDDGNISYVDSAFDLDGGPMIVGGGSAIPEPSGGLLFLLGGAALALRRRRRTPIEAAFAMISE